MLISNKTFMRILDYERAKHGDTKQRFCDDIGARVKDYDYYVQGIKTPPAGFVLAAVKYYGLGAF